MLNPMLSEEASHRKTSFFPSLNDGAAAAATALFAASAMFDVVLDGNGAAIRALDLEMKNYRAISPGVGTCLSLRKHC